MTDRKYDLTKLWANIVKWATPIATAITAIIAIVVSVQGLIPDSAGVITVILAVLTAANRLLAFIKQSAEDPQYYANLAEDPPEGYDADEEASAELAFTEDDIVEEDNEEVQ